jgi:hypothetical protein
MAKKKKNQNKSQDIVEDNKVETKNEEEDLFCDDLVLTNEQLLEIRFSHLERETINKDIKILYQEIQILDRQKELANLRVSDMKNRATIKDRDHKDLIENIGRKVGKSLLDSQINFETGRVTFS